MTINITLLAALLLAPLVVIHAADNDGALATVANTSQKVEANRVAEISLVSEKTYQNPFMELEFDAIVTQPDGKQLHVPGFWTGGNRWCFRYASATSGLHT